MSQEAGAWTAPNPARKSFAGNAEACDIRAGDRIWYRLKRDDAEGSFIVYTGTVITAREKVLQLEDKPVEVYRIGSERRTWWIDRSTVVIVDHEPAPDGEGDVSTP
jgi:hypothetical protein